MINEIGSQLEHFQQVLSDNKLKMYCYGIDEEYPLYYHMYIDYIDYGEKDYALLAELANKLILSLYEANIEDVKIEVSWGWGCLRHIEKIDSSACISIEILKEDLDAFIEKMLNLSGDVWSKIHRTI